MDKHPAGTNMDGNCDHNNRRLVTLLEQTWAETRMVRKMPRRRRSGASGHQRTRTWGTRGRCGHAPWLWSIVAWMAPASIICTRIASAAATLSSPTRTACAPNRMTLTVLLRTRYTHHSRSVWSCNTSTAPWETARETQQTGRQMLCVCVCSMCIRWDAFIERCLPAETRVFARRRIFVILTQQTPS